MKLDKIKWTTVFHSLYLSEIIPSNDIEWNAFFSNASSSINPEKYDNLRMAIVLGIKEKQYLGADFELLCKGIKEFINVSSNEEEINACKEYLNITNEYVRHGENLINFENSERVCFAANKVMRCLLKY